MQSQTKACIVSLLLIGLCATDVDAQAVHAGAPSAAPGLWYKGIYVGRMPQREKLLEHTPQARKDEFVRQASRQVEELHLEPEAFDLPDDTESRFVEPEGAFEEPAGDYESTVDYPASRNHYPPIRRGGHMAMGCGPAICCGDDRFFVSAEYLLYWSKGMDLPALATTSPDGTPDTEAGVLGFDDTTVLFGQDKVLDDARSGVRFALGYWLDSCATYALEGVYLSLEEESASFNASSDEFNILSRPFYNVTNDRQDARRLVFPNETTGSLQIDTDTRFQTVELLLRRNLSQRCGARIDLLLGYRFAELEERLRIDEATRVLSGVNAGTTFDLYDRFDTSNSFHGFEIGLAGTHCPDPLWTFDWRAKVALGSNNSEADIFGETTQTPNAGAAVTSEGGLLALPTNIGTFSDDSFGTITELGVTLKRRVFSRLDVSFGYSFLLWTHVARASDQIDVGINQTQLLPGGLNGDARPAVTQRTSDFWTQGLRVGLESHF